MTSLPKNPKPHYEGKNENLFAERITKMNSRKVVPELVRIIKESRKIEEGLRKRYDRAFL